MELIVVLIVFAALALGMAAYASYSPVNVTVVQNSLSSVPGSADFFSGWAGFLFKLAAGFLLTALFTALVAGILIPWIREQWRNSQGKGWKSGPNAHWGRDEQSRMSISKLIEMALASKILGGDSGSIIFPQSQEPPQENNDQQFPTEGWWQ